VWAGKSREINTYLEDNKLLSELAILVPATAISDAPSHSRCLLSASHIRPHIHTAQCKVIAPKFEEFSEKYPDAVFLKVIGDASPEASKLMKREGVRSVPSFHYFMSGEKVDVVNGANAEAIEAAITKHVSATA
jgi:hypothetical protein